MNKKFKYGYILILIMVLVVSSIGATYAYFAAGVSSSNVVSTGSQSYTMSMEISSLYDGFTIIPMDDEYVIRALGNECHDKYDRGVCLAYSVRLSGYDEALGYISGAMNVNTNNIQNLSYVTLIETTSDINDENCVTIDGVSYCKSINIGRVIPNENLSLGDRYDIVGTTEKKLLLVIWLTNLDDRQNDTDIGDFTVDVTFSMGDGGKIKGTIIAAMN